MSPSTMLPGGRVERHLPGDEQQLAGSERRPSRARWPSARPGWTIACFTAQAALTTLFERRQRVQTRMRRTPPLIIARTVWRLGSKRRALTLCAWLT